MKIIHHFSISTHAYADAHTHTHTHNPLPVFSIRLQKKLMAVMWRVDSLYMIH